MNMMDLLNREIKPVLPDTQCLTDSQIETFLDGLPEWEVIEKGQVKKLQRIYRFENFVDAMRFANTLTELAESVDHHPKITIEWGKASILWWTHTIGGLHENDFVMAYRTEQVYLSWRKAH